MQYNIFNLKQRHQNDVAVAAETNNAFTLAAKTCAAHFRGTE